MREGLQGFFLKIALVVLKFGVSIALRMDGGHAIMIPEARLLGVLEVQARALVDALCKPCLLYSFSDCCGLLCFFKMQCKAQQHPGCRQPLQILQIPVVMQHDHPTCALMRLKQNKCSRPALCSVLLD